MNKVRNSFSFSSGKRVPSYSPASLGPRLPSMSLQLTPAHRCQDTGQVYDDLLCLVQQFPLLKGQKKGSVLPSPPHPPRSYVMSASQTSVNQAENQVRYCVFSASIRRTPASTLPPGKEQQQVRTMPSSQTWCVLAHKLLQIWIDQPNHVNLVVMDLVVTWMRKRRSQKEN